MAMQGCCAPAQAPGRAAPWRGQTPTGRPWRAARPAAPRTQRACGCSCWPGQRRGAQPGAARGRPCAPCAAAGGAARGCGPAGAARLRVRARQSSVAARCIGRERARLVVAGLLHKAGQAAERLVLRQLRAAAHQQPEQRLAQLQHAQQAGGVAVRVAQAQHRPAQQQVQRRQRGLGLGRQRAQQQLGRLHMLAKVAGKEQAPARGRPTLWTMLCSSVKAARRLSCTACPPQGPGARSCAMQGKPQATRLSWGEHSAPSSCSMASSSSSRGGSNLLGRKRPLHA